MRDPVREAVDRTYYVNLPADVEIHYCTKDSPMDINGDDAQKLKQLWMHDDAEETEASRQCDGSYMTVTCPHCKYTYTSYLGD